MKVLVVTAWLPTRAHPETGSFVVRDIEMLRADHEVHVVHLAAGAEPVEVPFPVTTIRMPVSRPDLVAAAARALARLAADTDLVHTMAASALLPFRRWRPAVPWVHTEHWSALLAPRTAPLLARLALPLTRRLLARPDAVIAVGEQLATVIRAMRSGTTVVIPNEVPRAEAVTERPGTHTLVGVGALVARKGAVIAVEALAALRARGLDARLVWAGDGPERAAVQARAEALGIAAHVDLLGRVRPDEVAGVVAAADVFILPTAGETFGVAIAEALVAGRPVVTSDQGEQTAFVTEPDGVLVAERTGAAYADGVERALALNRDRPAAEIAAASRARFDPAARRAATAAVYNEAAGADVDVIIAAHDPRRDIARAVRSALGNRRVARVILVCHNADPADIAAALGDFAHDPRVERRTLHDGIRSPAGPFNAGLDHAQGRFIALLGSDDELTPGAIDAWRQTADRHRADVVIAPLRHAGGARIPTPPTRRPGLLRGVHDRLAYRTAPLGLVSRARFGALRFTPELATGEDLDYTTRLWFSDARVVLHRGAGEYLVHDGPDRVSFTPRPMAGELRAIEMLLADPYARALPPAARIALAVKLWRVPVFGAIHYRAGHWGAGDIDAVRGLVTALTGFAPGALDRLSRADRRLIDALTDENAGPAEWDALSARRRRFLRPGALLPRRLWLLAAREAPLRFAAATWWASRG